MTGGFQSNSGDGAPGRSDLTASGPVAKCDNCLAESEVEVGRAVYQLPQFESEGAFFTLLQKHGLQYDPVSRMWWAADGLSVDADGEIETRDRNDLSYITIRGPAGALASFVEDLLDAAVYVKRELRAPSLVEVANDAQERGVRVDDTDRLVPRDRAADVVSRLPEGEQ